MVRSPAGVWVIHQLAGATSAVTTQTNTALGTAGVVGYGPRIPASFLFRSDQTVDLSILDRHRTASTGKGKWFKPRVIWGRYTPSWAMGPRISGFSGPAPYLSGGGPNVAFESAYRALLEAEALWAQDKADVREIDCGWYSMDYSELYNGPEIQRMYGQSTSAAETNFVEAHKRLINIATTSSTDVPVGFGLSGHGPITNISGKLAAHAATKPLGSVYVQANGWNDGGEWGGQGEAGQDAAVWVAQKGKVACALQDIVANSRTASQVTKMWDNARTLQAQGVLLVYAEQYDFQWGNSAGTVAEMKRQIGLWEPTSLPTGDHEEELAALRALLAELLAELPALQETLDGDLLTLAAAQVVADEAQAAVDALAAEIADVETQIAALGG